MLRYDRRRAGNSREDCVEELLEEGASAGLAAGPPGRLAEGPHDAGPAVQPRAAQKLAIERPSVSPTGIDPRFCL